jgi:D-alanyl-D-alanine carboxypeptidase/D-alanyl-D-alanine-endopeptidase (penicillin-binding protein 4)
LKRGTLAAGILLALPALVPVQAARAEAVAVGRAALRRLAARGVAVTAELYDLERRRPLALVNPGLRLIPASLSKLYVAVAALRRWPADRRFVTRVYTSGRRGPRGTLAGALVLRGGGDPTLTYATLDRLALAVAALGIRRTTLPLVVVPGRLASVPCAPRERCRARRVADHAYAAPLSPLESDYGSYAVLVRPGRVLGSPAVATLLPFSPRALRLVDHVRTARHTFLNVVRTSGVRTTRIDVTGAVTAGVAPRRLYVAAGHPGRLTARLFRGLLRRAGVSLPPGDERRAHLPRGARLLVTERGASLAHVLHAMVAYSNNVIADLLTLDWARSVTGRRPTSLAAASALLAHGLATSLRRHGAERPPRLRCGSGLCVRNRTSARELVALLRSAYDRTALFPTLLGSLALPGQTPLRFIDDPAERAWEDRVAVKTGTLTSPYAVVGLAGYVRLADGDWGAFAVLVNGTARRPEIGVETALAAVRRFLAPYLKSRRSLPRP